jgi:hypothetical protein
MSRLAKNIIVSKTGRRFTDEPPMSTLTTQAAVLDAPYNNIAHEYHLEVRLGASTLVNDAIAEQSSPDSNIFTDAIRATRRKIVEEVFSEFRQLIYQINDAIHNRDWSEASRLTGKLYQQMFEDGL